MVSKEMYIKANVPMTIYNAVWSAFHMDENFYNHLYNRCFSYDNWGICSEDEYIEGVQNYLKNMFVDKNGFKKWIHDVSASFVSPSWRQTIRNDFNCKSNDEFAELARSIITRRRRQLEKN